MICNYWSASSPSSGCCGLCAHVVPSGNIGLRAVIIDQSRDQPESVIMEPDGRRPYAAVKQSAVSCHLMAPECPLPGGPVGLAQPRKLFFAVQHMADELPVLQVLAGVDGDAREGVEARRGTEEGLVSLRDVDTARIWVEAREDGVGDGGIRGASTQGRHAGREAQQEGRGEEHGTTRYGV